MSKKLIAVAAAAALALTGLVASPASANVSITGTMASAGLTKAGAKTLDVPADAEVTSADVGTSLVLVTVGLAAKGDKATVTSSDGVFLLDEPGDDDNKYTAKSGLKEWSYTAKSAGDDAVFYVYTTSTTEGTFSVEVGANKTTRWVVGDETTLVPYTLTVTAPSSVGTAAPAKANVVVALVDLFGNALTGVTYENEFDEGFVGSGTLTDVEWNGTNKRYEAKAYGTAAGPFSITINIFSDVDDVDGYADAKLSFFSTLNAADAETQVTALTAQVAALQAQLEASRPIATSVTKKRYNTLARKWNAANPSARVALKK
jgi:hypothetical protein